MNGSMHRRCRSSLIPPTQKTNATGAHLEFGPLVRDAMPRQVRRDEPDVRVGRVAFNFLHLREDELEDSREQGDDGQRIP